MEDDVEALTELTGTEEEISGKIAELEKTREYTLTEYCRDTGKDPSETKFSVLFTDKTEQEFLVEFRELIKEVSLMNERVKTLLGFVAEYNHILARSIMQGLEEQTYNKAGKGRNKQSINLLDVRV